MLRSCTLFSFALLCLMTHANIAAAECELGAEQREMLERVNDARSESRQCGDEEFSATEPLEWNCRLAEAAHDHSRNMAEEEFFGHTDTDDQGVAARVSDAGYVWQAVGENIAAGQTEVERVMQGWLESPGHCANIMSGDFSEMGAASFEEEGSRYSPFWTQVFAHPR